MHPSSNVPNAKVSVVQSVNIPSFICQFGAVLSTYRAAPEQENVMGHVKKQLQAALCRILAALPELHEQFGQLWAAPWCRRNTIELFHDRWVELLPNKIRICRTAQCCLGQANKTECLMGILWQIQTRFSLLEALWWEALCLLASFVNSLPLLFNVH